MVKSRPFMISTMRRSVTSLYNGCALRITSACARAAGVLAMWAGSGGSTSLSSALGASSCLPNKPHLCGALPAVQVSCQHLSIPRDCFTGFAARLQPLSPGFSAK